MELGCPSRLHSSYCAPCRRYTLQEPGNESLGLGILIAPPQNSRLQPQTPVQIHLSSGETSNTGSVAAITEGKCGIFSHAYVCRTLAQDTETSFLPLPDGRSNLYSVIHFFSLDSSVFEVESCLMQSKFQMSNVHHGELPRLWENRPFPLPMDAIKVHTLHCKSITVQKFILQTSRIIVSLSLH